MVRGKQSPARIEWIAASVAALSLIPRLWIAATTWLNPDEAGYFLHSTGGSLTEVYWNSLYTHHPPLLILILHFVREVSTSELALRLVPVLAGSLGAWFAFRWVSSLWNRTAGLVALVILAFAPFLLRLSAEARGYSLVMLAMAVYLYCHDKALEKGSSRWMLAAGAALATGILAEYSMAMFAASVGVYFLVRAWVERPPAIVVAVWVLVQSGALATYGFLYVNQVRRMAQLPSAEENRTGWLADAFVSPGENLAVHAAGAVADQFLYLFGWLWLSVIAICLFIAGLVLLWRKNARGRATALLLVLPFGFTLAANLAGYFPFGETRHTSFLGLFIAAGVAVACERLVRGRTRWLWTGVVLIPLWVALLTTTTSALAWERHRKDDMLMSLEDVRYALQEGGPVLCERATAWTLEYYLDGVSFETREFEYPDWQTVSRDIELLVAEHGSEHESYWYLDAGWNVGDIAVGETLGGLVVVEKRESSPAARLFRLEKQD
jgi:4-amino-4-deoxy-L-arabinose transferase-like glycosyltransferase